MLKTALVLAIVFVAAFSVDKYNKKQNMVKFIVLTQTLLQATEMSMEALKKEDYDKYIVIQEECRSLLKERKIVAIKVGQELPNFDKQMKRIEGDIKTARAAILLKAIRDALRKNTKSSESI